MILTQQELQAVLNISIQSLISEINSLNVNIDNTNTLNNINTTIEHIQNVLTTTNNT